jgi:hypothetical protein
MEGAEPPILVERREELVEARPANADSGPSQVLWEVRERANVVGSQLAEEVDGEALVHEVRVDRPVQLKSVVQEAHGANRELHRTGGFWCWW